MAPNTANDITESELAALADKFASWAEGLPQREQEILWQMMHTAATAEDDAQGFAAPDAGPPRMAESSPGPAVPPQDWNRESDFSYAFLSTFGGLAPPIRR